MYWGLPIHIYSGPVKGILADPSSSTGLGQNGIWDSVGPLQISSDVLWTPQGGGHIPMCYEPAVGTSASCSICGTIHRRYRNFYQNTATAYASFVSHAD